MTTDPAAAKAHRDRFLSVRNTNTATTAEAIKQRFNEHLHFTVGKDRHTASAMDYFFVLARTAQDHLIKKFIRTQQHYYQVDPKRVYYLSMEYLIGRTLSNTISNLNILDPCVDAMNSLGLHLEELQELEEDAGLGNGGLGRLAACFMDSLASLSIPAIGYGIRYEFGIFKQRIVNGEQVEERDDWLEFGDPWEMQRRDRQRPVSYYGRTCVDDKGKSCWVDTHDVFALAYDIPVPGFRNETCNVLRLWAAKSPNTFAFSDFNSGKYIEAVLDRNTAENISRVLYPNDNFFTGKELRFKQEYFLVAASLRDIIRRYKYYQYGVNTEARTDFKEFHNKVAIQLNDTHPSLAIPELMRVLVDEENVPWDEAWNVCTKTFAYTNHTVLPEALERWPVEMLGHMLPRHLEIIYLINHNFLTHVVMKRWPDGSRDKDLSIIEEPDQHNPKKRVNMARLAIVGSHAVNGVAAIHTEILKASLFKTFYELWPEKFQNKTNGITPRRWLIGCNPKLVDFLCEKLGPVDQWIRNLDSLKGLKSIGLSDQSVLTKMVAVKLDNKRRFAHHIKEYYKVEINPEAMFDVQVKRIHEYKRQMLNCLHVITMYLNIKKSPNEPVVPRVVMIGGKAAPGYWMAKQVISLICSVGSIINNDPAIGNKLKLIYLENYNVTLAEKVVPATDLSEQISLAGTEASGTGNMKFMMNGALTVGTLDGANVEMREEMGAENFFLFGMTVPQVDVLRKAGYNPQSFYDKSADLRAALDAIQKGLFSPSKPDKFKPVVENILSHDFYMICADFDEYIKIQKKVSEAYLDKPHWAKMALCNVAASGKFSSDRTIREYCKDIWKAQPCEPQRSTALGKTGMETPLPTVHEAPH